MSNYSNERVRLLIDNISSNYLRSFVQYKFAIYLLSKDDVEDARLIIEKIQKEYRYSA